MSQVIVIDSSDDGGEDGEMKKNSILESSVSNSGRADHEGLFNEFCELSKMVIKENENGKKILNYLMSRHNQAAQQYKLSRSYRKVLQKSISKLKTDSKDVYVHVHNIILILDKNSICSNDKTGKDQKHVLTAKVRKETGKRPGLLEVDITDAAVNSDCTSMALDSDESYSIDTKKKKRRRTLEMVKADDTSHSGAVSKPSTSTVFDCSEPFTTTSTSEHERQLRRSRRVKNLEIRLKEISTEIIRLQSQELTLDDLDREDTSYILESKLKRRFMQIYKEICRLNKTNPLTGRFIEKKIKVTASRFPEVNRKVELYINNPKCGFNLPDFEDVCHLVKQASIKNELGLGNSEEESIAKCIFDQIGGKWQKRRQRDFFFEFGSSVIDKDKHVADPSLKDPELSKKLSENSIAARRNLDSVIQKYSSMQKEIGEREPENPALKEDEERSEDDSDSDVEIIPVIETQCEEVLNKETTVCSNSSSVSNIGDAGTAQHDR